jgi:hypothetical protein
LVIEKRNVESFKNFINPTPTVTCIALTMTKIRNDTDDAIKLLHCGSMAEKVSKAVPLHAWRRMGGETL